MRLKTVTKPPVVQRGGRADGVGVGDVQRERKNKKKKGGGGRKIYLELCQCLNLASMCRQPIIYSQASEIAYSALLSERNLMHTSQKHMKLLRQAGADLNLPPLAMAAPVFLCRKYSG